MKLGSLDAIQCVYIIIIFFFIRKFLFSKSVNFHTKQIGRKLVVIVVQIDDGSWRIIGRKFGE